MGNCVQFHAQARAQCPNPVENIGERELLRPLLIDDDQAILVELAHEVAHEQGLCFGVAVARERIELEAEDHIEAAKVGAVWADRLGSEFGIWEPLTRISNGIGRDIDTKHTGLREFARDGGRCEAEAAAGIEHATCIRNAEQLHEPLHAPCWMQVVMRMDECPSKVGAECCRPVASKVVLHVERVNVGDSAGFQFSANQRFGVPPGKVLHCAEMYRVNNGTNSR